MRIDEERLRLFKEGIFELRTRRFGTVAEIMIKKKYNLEKSTNIAYDLLDPITGDRAEVKFSTVMRSNDSIISEDNVIEQCINANLRNRMVTSDELYSTAFDCNIQQVKRKEFEVLYYGLFLYDRIVIFKLFTDNIFLTLGYSDFQHRGNEGEGQFHITNRSVQYHFDNNFVEWLTYEELYELFSN
jgi:hypothetical protein